MAYDPNKFEQVWIYESTDVVKQPPVIDYYSWVNGSAGYVVYGVDYKRGQSFTGIDAQLTSIAVSCYHLGDPTGNVYLEIYAHSGTYGTNSVGTGDPLAISDGVDITTFSHSPALKLFTFSGANQITLSAGTYYVWTLKFEDGYINNYAVLYGDNTSPTHSGNSCAYIGTWSASTAVDYIFYVFSSTLIVNCFDSVSITENILSGGTIFVSVSDTISVTETSTTFSKFIDVSDNIIINENVDIPPSKVRIKIDTTDRTKYIVMDSLIIENVLTSQVDLCSFTIKKISGSTKLNYNPTIGNDVIITFLNDKIFGGVITKVTQRIDSYGIIEFLIECCDYTRFLDRKLVADTFSEKTVNEIIQSITTDYLTGFTTNNVSCTLLLDYIGFNYISVSKVLTDLANLTHYDWYVDYNKDIHFFAKDSQTAPFNLEDGTNTYILDSLQLKQDNSQLRNVIYVRGGEYLADTFTTEILCDGIKTIYNIPYKYEGLSVTTSAEGGAGTGQSLAVGLDYIDTAESYDVLWNFQEKVIKFRDSRKPNDTNVLRVGGRPYLPVRVKTSNRVSIDEMKLAEGGSGEYEYVIIDESIKTKQAALERADAELSSYKSTLVEGEFSTYQNGLKAGQQILINSAMHEINERYLINRVITRIFANEIMIYNVNVVSTKTYGIIEFLQDLLLRENKKLLSQGSSVETIDIVENMSESFSLSATFTSSISHNMQIETITLNEVKTEHALDWGVEWVLGPYIPTDVSTDTKRVFCFDGSKLS
jgi:hypothetical protein